MSREISDSAERDALRHHLSNLLARIHGDGGHYQQQHGTDKAVEDADAVICALRGEVAEVRRVKIEDYKDQIGQWQSRAYKAEKEAEAYRNAVAGHSERWEAAEAALAAERAEVVRLKNLLRFVERWANHHGTMPCVTPTEALSMIQHHPSITAITRGYVDGVVPATPNPYAELAAERERAEANARDAEYLRWRLTELLPLFEEARDALPAITETARALHYVSPTLADRMDAAGTRTREQFDTALAAQEGV